VTGETPDISEYLDFGFYDQVWYKDNVGLSPSEPGRWLGVSSRTGRMMCYWILNQCSTVQRVTTLEMFTPPVKDIFDKFDQKIHHKLKLKDCVYVGNKPNPDDLADLMENDEDFREEFANIYNAPSISDADNYTPEIGDDTYVNTIPRGGDGTEFARVGMPMTSRLVVQIITRSSIHECTK